MAILGLEHTSYTVKDVDAAVDFWSGALGFRLISRGPWLSAALGRAVGVPGAEMTIAILEGYGHQVEFIAYVAKAGRQETPSANDNLSSHVAFRCTDIGKTAASLVADGVSMAGTIEHLTDDPNDSGWCVYLRDPNGVIFELIEPSESCG